MSSDPREPASAPTPAPWAPNGNRVESRDEHGVANDGWIICECTGPDARANAKHIAEAVNAQSAAVLRRLALAERACERAEEYIAPDPPTPENLDLCLKAIDDGDDERFERLSRATVERFTRQEAALRKALAEWRAELANIANNQGEPGK